MKVKQIAKKLLKEWDALENVPDCPSCKGTGMATGKDKGWNAEPVYWKGQIVWVCHQCKGRGKV